MGSTQETVRESGGGQNQEKKMGEFVQHQRRGQRLFQRTVDQGQEAQNLWEEAKDLFQGIVSSVSDAIDAAVENFFGGSRTFALKVVVGVLVLLAAVATFFLCITEDSPGSST